MVKIVNTLPEGQWRQFVESQPSGNIFHMPEMFEVFRRAKGFEPVLWAAIDGDAKILALITPVQITLVDGWLRFLTTRAVAYGSVLCNPSPAGKEALSLLLRAYLGETKRNVLFTELRNLFDMDYVQPVFSGCGFGYEDHLNYLIDLDRPVEEIMQSIGPRTRKHIRRGLRKQEVVIEEVSEPSLLIPFYSLLQQSFAFAGVPLADRSLFEAAFDVLHPRGMVKFWLARVGEAYVSASAELVCKDVVYGWYGGVDRGYGKYAPGELLTWRILEWGAKNGFRVYDFGGAGKPDEEYGVREFKAKFGGELVCYGRNTYVHAPFNLAISKVGYEFFRALVACKP